MKIKASKSGRCAYPPIGKYISTPPAAKSFKAHEIQLNFKPGTRLRPEGSRQSEAEANILSRIQMIQNGLVPNTLDIMVRSG